jgi:hypothetical protein
MGYGFWDSGGLLKAAFERMMQLNDHHECIKKNLNL